MKFKWKCVTDEKHSQTSGATWAHKGPEGLYFVTIMPHWNDESELPWYVYARWLGDLSIEIPDAVNHGYGMVLGSSEGKDADAAKRKGMKIVRQFVKRRTEEQYCPLRRTVNRPLSYLDKKRRVEAGRDPFAYLQGYIDGSRGRTPKLTSQSYTTGWNHGRDYSRGEAEPPNWLIERSKDANH